MSQTIDVPGQGLVEFPDGMSDADIVAAIKKNSMTAAPAPTPFVPSGEKGTLPKIGPTAVSALENFGAAMSGKPFFDALNGAAYRGGAAVNDAAAKVLPAPVAAGLGVATNIGIQSIPSIVLGGIGSSAGRTSNMARQSANEVEDATLAAGRSAGLGVPVSEVNPGGVRGFVNNMVESLGGKAAIRQEQTLRNAETTNRLAAQELEMPPNTALSEARVKSYIQGNYGPYQEVANLPPAPPTWLNPQGGYPRFSPPNPAPADSLRELKIAREHLTDYLKDYRQGSGGLTRVELSEKIDALKTTIASLEKNIADAASSAGRQELVPALAKARQNIAKAYDVKDALNVGSGGVSAPVLGRALDRGAPLSGNLKTIATFQQAFPKFMGEAEKVGAPGVSALDALVSGGFGAGGFAAGGLPGISAALLWPAARAGARELALSPLYQQMMARTYGSSPMLTGLGAGAGGILGHYMGQPQ